MDMKTKPLPERVQGLRVDGDRLWASLMELAQIGATPKGGVCRLTLTDLDKQGRAGSADPGVPLSRDRAGPCGPASAWRTICRLASRRALEETRPWT